MQEIMHAELHKIIILLITFTACISFMLFFVFRFLGLSLKTKWGSAKHEGGNIERRRGWRDIDERIKAHKRYGEIANIIVQKYSLYTTMQFRRGYEVSVEIINLCRDALEKYYNDNWREMFGGKSFEHASVSDTFITLIEGAISNQNTITVNGAVLGMYDLQESYNLFFATKTIESLSRNEKRTRLEDDELSQAIQQKKDMEQYFKRYIEQKTNAVMMATYEYLRVHYPSPCCHNITCSDFLHALQFITDKVTDKVELIMKNGLEHFLQYANVRYAIEQEALKEIMMDIEKAGK